MNNLFSFDYLHTSEINAKKKTRDELYGLFEQYPKIIDLFCRLPYFKGELHEVNTPLGGVQNFCYMHFVQAPYTFWAIYSLFEKAYYLEAIVILRHLIEAHIQMKYFVKYPDKHLPHFKNEKRISFKKMFDEFSKGYYKDYYGKQYSEAAHGFFLKHVLRFFPSGTRTATPRIGCTYDPGYATYVINTVLPIILAYLNDYERVFPENTITSDKSIIKKLDETRDWINRQIEGHKEVNPNSVEYYEIINGIIE